MGLALLVVSYFTGGGKAASEEIHYPALFGTQEARSSDLALFPKWQGIFAQCREGTPVDRLLPADLKSRLAEHLDADLATKMAAVNRAVNQRRYVLDADNWGLYDHWSTPDEFWARGGDCEDFAVTKYLALRHLGLPVANLRVAVVKDAHRQSVHAVTIVYQGPRIWVLDNRSRRVRPASEVKHYEPIYSINERFWWRHLAPPKN